MNNQQLHINPKGSSDVVEITFNRRRLRDLIDQRWPKDGVNGLRKALEDASGRSVQNALIYNWLCGRHKPTDMLPYIYFVFGFNDIQTLFDYKWKATA